MLFLNEGYGKELNKMMKGGKRGVSTLLNKIPFYGLRVPEGDLEVLRNGQMEINWEGIEKLVNSPLSEDEQYWLKRLVLDQKETREKIKKEREGVKYIKNCPAKAWATLGGKKLREKMIERSLKKYIRSDEDEYIARTIGAFRSADLEEEVTLLDSLSFELEREDEAAHAAFDSSFESHWLWLNDGPITIVGKKKEVRKAFVADCWSEYDEWSKELKETRGSNLSFSSIWEAKAVKESLVAAGVRWASNHSEIFASGKFEVEQVFLNPEKIKEEELQQLVLFLEDKKIQWSFYHWNKEKEREVRKELSFDWYESLVPANSKVALWD